MSEGPVRLVSALSPRPLCPLPREEARVGPEADPIRPLFLTRYRQIHLILGERPRRPQPSVHPTGMGSTDGSRPCSPAASRARLPPAPPAVGGSGLKTGSAESRGLQVQNVWVRVSRAEGQGTCLWKAPGSFIPSEFGRDMRVYPHSSNALGHTQPGRETPSFI